MCHKRWCTTTGLHLFNTQLIPHCHSTCSKSLQHDQWNTQSKLRAQSENTQSAQRTLRKTQRALTSPFCVTLGVYREIQSICQRDMSKTVFWQIWPLQMMSFNSIPVGRQHQEIPTMHHNTKHEYQQSQYFLIEMMSYPPKLNWHTFVKQIVVILAALFQLVP